VNSASTPLDQDLSQNTSPGVPTYGGRYTLALWIFALAIMSFGGQIYSEITGDWFPTFIHSTAGYPYVYWGYLTAAISILGAIFFLIFGAVSDNLRTRYGRRIPLIVLGGITTAILTALFVISTNYLWLFVNYGILTAVTYNLVRGSSSPLTADLIPLDKRGRVNTLLTVMTNVASAVVWIPALILLPGNATSYPPDTVRLFVYVGAAVFGISMVVGALLIKEPPVLEPPRGWVADLKSTLEWQEMKNQKSFLLILLANFFLQAASSAIFNYLFVFIQNINFNFDLPTLIGAAIVGVDCDIWIPAARPDVVNMSNVDSIRAKLLLQGANVPVSPEAEERLRARGILSLPDFIVNAGGVICAAVEYRGGTESLAFQTIDEKIRKNTRAVLEAMRLQNISPQRAAL